MSFKRLANLPEVRSDKPRGSYFCMSYFPQVIVDNLISFGSYHLNFQTSFSILAFGKTGLHTTYIYIWYISVMHQSDSMFLSQLVFLQGKYCTILFDIKTKKKTQKCLRQIKNKLTFTNHFLLFPDYFVTRRH